MSSTDFDYWKSGRKLLSFQLQPKANCTVGKTDGVQNRHKMDGKIDHIFIHGPIAQKVDSGWN
jgi:hypothetical protein